MSSIPYLDYAATTPLDPRVRECMLEFMSSDTGFGNASSTTHAYRWQSACAVEEAAEQVAAPVNAQPQEIIWTSGATESDNLAIVGAARYRQDRGKHLVTMPTEHKAVTDVFHQLEKRGFEVTWLHPDASGRVSLDALEQALHDRQPVQDAGLIHHSDRGSQYVSIKYTERLAEAGIEPSVGSVGDSYDNALAETVIGLFKTEVIHRRGPWRSVEAVEFATLEWVDWFNNRRLLEPIGNIPPAEAEARFFAQSREFAMVA